MHVPRVNTLFLSLGDERVGGAIPVPVLVMFVLFVLAAVLLHRTRFGQHLCAMGGNREAALFAGVPVGESKSHGVCYRLAAGCRCWYDQRVPALPGGAGAGCLDTETVLIMQEGTVGAATGPPKTYSYFRD